MMRYKTLIAKVAIFSLVLSLVAVVSPAQAASLTDMSDTMTRQAQGVASDHTILFTLGSAIATGDDLTITFATNFSISASLASADLDISWQAAGGDGVCNTGDTQITVDAGAASGATWGFTRTSALILTLDAGDGGIAAGAEVCVEIGTVATTGGTGVNQVTNASSAASYDLVIATPSDSGTIQLPVVDGDQVTINAAVESTMTFDLDVGIATGTDCSSTTCMSNTGYTVDLGTLTTAAVSTSGDGTIGMIGVDISANATGGVVVTVKNANGAEGLASTSAGPDTGASESDDDIESGTGDLTAGTEGYGICVHRVSAGANSTLDGAGTGAFDADSLTSGASSFDLSDTCTGTDTVTENNVGNSALSTTPQNILDSGGGPIADGRAEIFVKAAIANTTPAHDDYTDTLTFIATGTF
ncbi:hypothetical protein KJ611_01660 [Patescibacteria group bacterium]|nr:hypothetical protein [Patescibacteria group bacterium]MBU1705418.1 hypothetical protein [Patescibacteria group bacterium]